MTEAEQLEQEAEKQLERIGAVGVKAYVYDGYLTIRSRTDHWDSRPFKRYMRALKKVSAPRGEETDTEYWKRMEPLLARKRVG